MFRKRLMSKRLPDNFQEVEYIYSSSYETGILLNITTAYKAIFDIKFDSKNNRVLIGSGTGAGQYWGKANNDKYELGEAFRSTINNATDRNIVIVERFGTSMRLSVNSEVVTRSSVGGISGNLLHLKNIGSSYSGGVYYYSVKVFQSDILTYELVPCYRITDHKPGLFDLVRMQFLVNSGTGEDFTLGPEVF